MLPPKIKFKYKEQREQMAGHTGALQNPQLNSGPYDDTPAVRTFRAGSAQEVIYNTLFGI